ncbi:MAG: phosphatase PAP2 family protein [Sphingobacteriales bacterium]|nr:MAG: phosphatase PAP2 family protein [Sphingobacteriales bacterium]TAF83839.1 MAG: phosphatase PAP2 family protein [Sphingobacteriales bacterium]
MIQSFFKTFKYFTVTYIIILCLSFICLATNSKENIFLYINSKHLSFFDTLFTYTTYLGDGWSFGIFLGLIFFFVKRKLFYLGVAIFAATSLVSTIFKRLIFYEALRPLSWFKNPKLIHFVDGVTIYNSNSFPSGHTITAFALAIYATYLIKNKYYGLLFLAIAMMVGYSRIYLGQHFFADVTFGSLISVLTSFFCVFIYERFYALKY